LFHHRATETQRKAHSLSLRKGEGWGEGFPCNIQQASRRESGFTLLEVLMALTVFALIVVVCYTALGPAGEGFRQLQERRDTIESAAWIGKQLRADVAYLSSSSLKTLRPIQLRSDARGDTFADQLTLLVREAGRSGLTLVHYKLDEVEGVLVRESRMAWARPNSESSRMILGKADSLHVEMMDTTGQWQPQWLQQTALDAPQIWPRAIRITMQQSGVAQTWLLPVWLGLP